MPYVSTPTVIAVLLILAAFTSDAADAPADCAISEILGAFVKPGDPGCTVGVTQNGTLSHALAFGLADIERGKPLDTHSTFDLASVSKQFTAFALLLLQQKGKLSLDDPLVNYMPELAASAKGVTLRHLVRHIGGLRDYIALLTMRGRTNADGSTIHETVQALARQTRPNAESGVEYEYSNTGYFLLGVVIARVSGQSLAEFSEDQIFRPLGMANSRIVDRYPDRNVTRARGYANTGKGLVIDETGWEQVGDGGVHSDLHDLARFAGAYYSAEAVAQCRIYLRDGRLVVEGCAEGAVLEPGKTGEFTDEDESFTLRFPGNGSDSGSFIYNIFGLRELPFTRVTEQSR